MTTRPEGMSDDLEALATAMKADCNEHVNGQCHTLACYKRGGYQGFGPATDFTPTCQAKQVLGLIEECKRLRADGATLLPTDWLRAFDALLRRHEIPDGLIVAEFTAWAARVMKGARVGLDEALAAHSASFGALATLSAALFDGEVDDYAALAEKIIARVRQLEADGATLRERVRTREEAERTLTILAMEKIFNHPKASTWPYTEVRSGVLDLIFASAPKEQR